MAWTLETTKRRLRTEGLPLALIAAGALAQAVTHGCASSGREGPAGSAPYWGAHINTRMVRRFLGLSVLASDLVWIDLLYKCDVDRTGDFSPFYKAMRSIKELDPQNYLAFWFGGLYLSVIKDDIQGASQLFKGAVEGLEGDPWVDSSLRGSIYFAYAYHLLYEERDTAAAARYMSLAADSAPPEHHLSREMAKKLSTERGRMEVSFRVLNDFHRRAKGEEEKRRVEEKMARLLREKELLDLNEGFDDYVVRAKAGGMARDKVFRLYLRSINHRGVDLFGARLKLDDAGRVTSEGGGP